MGNSELEVTIRKRTAELRNTNERLQMELAERKQAEQTLRESENQFRSLAETASDAIVTIDEKGRILFINHAGQAMFGYSQEEMLNQDFMLLIPEYRPGLHRTGLARHEGEEGGAPAEAIELRGVRKDGGEVPLELSFGEFTQSGKRFVTSIARDITERKQAEEALRKSEKLYRNLARNFPNGGVALFDRELRYLIADGSDLGSVGLSKDLLEGRTIWEVFSPEVSRTLEPIYRKALAGKTTVEELSLRGRVYMRHAVPISDEKGEIFAGMVMSQDITERKQADETLRRTEIEYRHLVESVQAIVWRRDARTFQFSFVSKEAETLLGYPAEQWVCEPTFWKDHIHPDDRDEAVSGCALATEQERDHEFEYRMIAADGRVVWLRDKVRLVVEDGGVKELVGVMMDVTERKLSEEAVRESEKKFSTIFATIPDVVMIVRLRDWVVIDTNDAWTQLTGYEKTKTTESLRLMVKPEAREWLLQTLLESGEARNVEGHYRIKDGSLRCGLASARLMELDGEQCAVAIVKDITERRQAEEELKQSREQLRALSSHLQLVREEERTHIAREVHDELGQALTALKIDLYAMQRGLARECDLDRLAEKMKTMSSLIDSTIQSVRRIATELRPGILDDLGLVAAVEWQANDFQARTGVSCEVASLVDYLELDRDRSTATFRILQETLTNVARHAEASKVDILLRQVQGDLILEVKDNGKGITENDIIGARSLGLLGMRERAQLLGGDLKIAGAPGVGTIVTVTIPL